MTATIEFPARRSSDFITPEELRALLKSNLGLNARQVSVKRSHSLQYLDITIRDASVSIAAVKQFAKTFNTWSMDITDYVSGQSINVKLTTEVEDALAAPYLALIESAEIPQDRGGIEILPGFLLWNIDGNIHVSARGNGKRTHNVWLHDVEMKSTWAIRSLALNLAMLVADS